MSTISRRSLAELTLTEVLAGVQKKAFSMREVQNSVHQAIAKKNEHLNVYLAHHVKAPTQEFSGVLLGAPIAVKDNILTPGLVTTASANVLRGYQPHYEATVARKLREAGGYIIGKTNMDAWAHGSSTETSDFGPTRNPRNPDYMPGGSSGGAAAAIAADMAIASIGTETAGSIRLPAAWCGLVGIKPTYGRVSRAGIVAMGSSLDSPGPMTKTVTDGALLLEVLAGQDKYDGTTGSVPVPQYSANLDQPLKGMKIGVIYLDMIEDPAVREVYEKLVPIFERLGATVTVAQAMDPNFAIGVYAVVQRGEVSSNLARYDGIRYGQDRTHFGDEAKRRIMLGTYTLSKGYADQYYTRAQQVRTKYIQDFQRLFSEFDVVLAPSTPGYALKLGESAKYPFFGELMDKFVEPCSLAGLPGVSVPCHWDTQSGLPLGLNIMTPHWEEQRMLQVAYAFEQATEFNPWSKRIREENV